MKIPGSAGKRIAQAILLVLSVVFISIVSLQGLQRPPVRREYSAVAPDVSVTVLPGLPQNWMLNAADADALEVLPGVGTVIAERIVQVREADGPFFFAEDVMTVKGIGEKTLQSILLWLEEHPGSVFIPVSDTETIR